MNRSRIRCLFLLPFVLLTSALGFSQMTSETLTSSQDSYIDSRYPRTNFGLLKGMYSVTGKYGRSGSQYYQRSFVAFDLSFIPANAVISSASMEVTRATAVSGGSTWKTKLVTSSWTETGITASNQPSISTLAGDVVNSNPTRFSNLDVIDVKDMVQRMVLGEVPNYGWSIQVNDENTSINTGAELHTRNQITYQKPKLTVQYYIPLSIATASISHESGTGTSDGGVSITLNGGASSSYTYTWINGATGAQISSSTQSTPLALTGQPYGWYGLHITGSNGEEIYQAFIIGQECAEVTIAFQPNTNYTDNSYSTSLDISGIGGLDYRKIPGPNYYRTRASKLIHSNWYEVKTWLNFKLWIDDRLNVNQADMTLKGVGHSSRSGSNESQFDIVTQTWKENNLTWLNSPTTNNSTTVNIPSKATQTENSVVDLVGFWNVWKGNNSSNYGMMLKLQTTNNQVRQQSYHSPDASDVENRPSIEFKVDFTPASPLSPFTWDIDTELGEITVDISGVCVKTPPYFFFISNDTIPGLDSLYTYISDTLIGIDSLTFYGLSTTNQTKTYENLANGYYHLSAFDVNGLRLFDEGVHIQGDIIFDAQTGLTANGPEIIASQANSIGSLKHYTYEELNSQIDVELKGTSGIQFFGYANYTETVTTYQDLELGFYLNGTSLYTVDRGILSGAFVTVTSDAKFTFINNQGAIELFLNGVHHLTNTAPSKFEYKFGLGVQPAQSLSLSIKGDGNYKSNPRLSYQVLRNFDCNGSPAEFRFSVVNPISGIPSAMTYSIIGPNGAQTLNISSYTFTDITISQVGGNLLLPGEYTVYGTVSYNGSSLPFSETINIGYEANWTQNSNYELIPNDYSLDRDAFNLTDFATARSINIMKFDVDGWIEFEPLAPNSNSANVFRFTTIDLNGPVSSNIFNDAFIATFKFMGSYYFISNDPTASAAQQFQLYPITTTSKVKLEFVGVGGSGGIAKIYIDGQLEGSIARPYSSVLARCQSLSENDGFKNVLTSFDCGGKQTLEEVSHAHVKRRLDGGHTVAVENKLKFTLDGEYDNGSSAYLEYNIYDENRNKVRGSSPNGNVILGSQAVLFEFDDNRYELDLNGVSAFVTGAYYILEVIDIKGEKRYLKFLYKY